MGVEPQGEQMRLADPDPSLDKEKEHLREYTLKAAFLHHFFKYTTWPDVKDKENPPPLELWIIGTDPFGDIIDKTFKGKVLQGRSIAISRKKTLPTTIDAHMVFVAGLNDKDRTKLIKLCSDNTTLLVGERGGFATSGAHANFYLENSRVHFEINTEAVKQSGLAISSELLKLAKIVKTKRPPEKQS